MKRAHKATAALSGALAIQSLGTGCVGDANSTPPPPQKVTDAERAVKALSGRDKTVKLLSERESGRAVERVQPVRTRPDPTFDPELSMPAGTGYDVIRRSDLG
jgi:hypothetical protein